MPRAQLTTLSLQLQADHLKATWLQRVAKAAEPSSMVMERAHGGRCAARAEADAAVARQPGRAALLLVRRQPAARNPRRAGCSRQEYDAMPEWKQRHIQLLLSVADGELEAIVVNLDNAPSVLVLARQHEATALVKRIEAFCCSSWRGIADG